MRMAKESNGTLSQNGCRICKGKLDRNFQNEGQKMKNQILFSILVIVAAALALINLCNLILILILV